MTNYAPVYVQLVDLCVNLTVQVLDYFVLRYRILRSVSIFNKVFSGVKDGVVVVLANGHPVMSALPLQDLPNALRVVLPLGEDNSVR